jgi:UDP-N-acetylmuramoyl-tripeptide--D-alanyl-D-alanine ligase
MEYLTSVADPIIGVVTRIGVSHLEYFGSIEAIEKEKGMLVEDLKPGGWAILNHDDERSKNIRQRSKVKVLTYGFKEGADLKASDLKFSFENSKEVDNLIGISFKLTYNGSTVPVYLPGVIGYGAIYAALSGAAVGVVHDINLVEISKALSEYTSPRGRMNIMDGVKRSLIIDDTYNSSPQSCLTALDWMAKINVKSGARKLAVLGDMFELGSYSEEGHQEVGAYVFKSGVKKLFTVGERARDIARGAEEAGMSRDDIFNFDNADEAKKFIEKRIREGDLILVKGSQSMRMEKIVKEIMANPLQAEYLLVRQGPEWLEK